MTAEEAIIKLVTLLESRSSDGDTLLNMEEAAQLLRISRQAVKERVRMGKMPKPIPASTRRHPLWRKRDLIGGE